MSHLVTTIRNNRNWGMVLLVAIICFAGLPALIDIHLYPKLWMMALIVIGMGIYNIVRSSGTGINLSIPMMLWVAFLMFSIPAALASSFLGQAALVMSRDFLVIALAMMFSQSDFKGKEALWLGAALSLLIMVIWGGVDLLGALDRFQLTHQNSYQIKASLGHRNLYGHFLSLCMVLALPLLWRGKRQSLFTMLLIGAASLMCFVTLSRGTWISCAVALMVLTLGLIKVHQKLPFKLGRLSRWIVAFLILIAVIFAVFVVDELYTLVHQFETAVNIKAGTTRDRWMLLKYSWTMFLDHPFIGVGIGHWPIELLTFDQTGMLSDNGRTIYQRPHSDFFWVFSERGVFAGLAYAAVFVVGVILSMHEFFTKRSPKSLALMGAWILMVLIAFTNFPMERMEFAVVMAVLISLSEGGRIVKFGRLANMAVIGLSFLAMYTFTKRIMAERHYGRAQMARENADWNMYLTEIRSANGAFLPLDEVARPLKWHEGLALSRLDSLEAADKAFFEAADINPNNPEVQNAVGVSYANRRDLSNALKHFSLSTKNIPRYQEGILNVAQIQRAQGDWRSAFDTYLKADYTLTSLGYENLGVKLAGDSLTNMIEQYPERKLMLTIQAIRNTPSWSFSVIRNCAQNGIPFPRQVLMDACYYMLSNCDGDEECDEVKAIKMHYIPNDDLNLND
ncbi:MAG: O-antigen ligase family protein [Flavobacteriales bacterium]